MKKAILILTVLLATMSGAKAQNDGFKLSWHGMVNPVAWGETRDGVSGREGMMYFYPKPVQLDSEGNDINGTPSLNMLAITARLNLTIQGPDIWGAKTKGFIEGDFTGSNETTINCFRLRHAYLNMRWEHADMLAGQYWYPMVVHEIMPNTQPLNMGAPFHPYARYNQLRYTHHLGNLELMGTAAFQLDNKSQGPLGSSTQYIKRSCVPEMNFQIRYNGLGDNNLFFGAAYNLLVVRPEDDAVAYMARLNRVGKNLPSHSFSLFARYDCPCGWSLRAQTLLNNNLYEGCTMGGYLIAQHVLNGNMFYEPWHFTTMWLDISRTKGAWRPGIFVGYGYKNDISLPRFYRVNEAYGRGYDINTLFRVQPHLGYDTGKGLSLWGEVEYTVADYAEQGRADNTRFILSAVYAF